MGTPIRGFGGIITITATNLGEIRNWSYETSGDDEDTSVMGTTRTDITNIKTRGSIEVYANHWDMTDPAQDAGQALLAINQVVAAVLRPNGTGSGKPELSANIKITAIRASAAHDGFAEGVFDYEIDGAEEWTDTAQA